VITKGAPEVVLDRCAQVPAGSLQVLEGLFGEGARVVAVATRPAGDIRVLTAAAEHGLTLEGFLTFADRPKADAGASIAQLRRLGIEVKIITGDNGLVAATVCRQIGVDCAGVLTGREIESLDDEQLAAAIPGRRCSPGSARTRNPGSSRSRAGQGRMSRSWATGSTMPSRCITPTWAYR
jgi:P-type Mg2+ transporter